MVDELTTEQKVYSILCYIPILVLIPLIMKKSDDFIHFHAKQGLIVFILWLIVLAIGLIPQLIIAVLILMLALIVLDIVAIVHVVKGEMWEIPHLHVFADRLNF